jgi:hypothetical protein
MRDLLLKDRPRQHQHSYRDISAWKTTEAHASAKDHAVRSGKFPAFRPRVHLAPSGSHDVTQSLVAWTLRASL